MLTPQQQMLVHRRGLPPPPPSPAALQSLTEPVRPVYPCVCTWRHNEDRQGVQKRQQPGRQDPEGVSPGRQGSRNPEEGGSVDPAVQEEIVGGSHRESEQ